MEVTNACGGLEVFALKTIFLTKLNVDDTDTFIHAWNYHDKAG